MWDQGSKGRDQGSLPWDQESESKHWDQSNFLKIETQISLKLDAKLKTEKKWDDH